MGGVFGPFGGLMAAVAQDAYALLSDTMQERRRARKAHREPRSRENDFSPINLDVPDFETPDFSVPAEFAPPAYLAPRDPQVVRSGVTVADSYSAEMDRPGVACRPCTMRHLTTIHEAAQTAMESEDPAVWRQQFAIIAAEAVVWERYDLTPEKLARADAEVRRAVTAAQPRMRALLSSLRLAPARLSLAWGALLEARRFAEGRAPTDADWAEVQERVADTLGWIGYMESTDRATLGDRANDLRPARQSLTSEGPTPEVLAHAEAVVGAVAVALTPEPTREEVEHVHRETKAARDEFFAAAMPGVFASRTKPPVAPRGKAYLDVDARLPEKLARAYLDVDPEAPTIAEGLGATAESRQAFARLAEFSRERGVPVSDEVLPPQYALEGSDIVDVGVVEGAYFPSPGGREDAIYTGPQAVVGAPKDCQMLAEEVAHSLLDNDHCNVWRSLGKGIAYDEMPEEREAKLAAMIALLDAGLPIQTDAGRVISGGSARLRVDRMESQEDPRIVARAKWAADIMGVALQGHTRAAAEESKGTCPAA